MLGRSKSIIEGKIGRELIALSGFARHFVAALRVSITAKVGDLTAPNRPCGNCPWRLDVAPGEFSVERYKVLAASAYDRSFVIFQCHKSTDEKPVACAGFLSRGATHNLAVRLAYSSKRIEPKDRSGGLKLHPNFRSLAIANGVDPHDPSLRDCRDD